MWWTAAVGWVVQIIFGLLGLEKKQPTVKPEEKVGQLEVAVQNEEKGREELQAAANARADADAQRVRNDPGAGKVDASPGAPLNRDPDGEYRD